MANVVTPDNHFCEQDQNEENQVPGSWDHEKCTMGKSVLLVEWSFYRREFILRNLWVEADFCLGAGIDAGCVNFSGVLKSNSALFATYDSSTLCNVYCIFVDVCLSVETLRTVPANRRLSLLRAQTSVSSPSLKFKLSWNHGMHVTNLWQNQ